MRKLMMMLTVAAMGAALAGCGSKTSEPAKTEAPKTETGAPASTDAAGGDESQAEASADMGEVVNFKLAENQPDGNPITEGMKMFAEKAKEYSGGTVNIEVYASEQLADESSAIDQLQAGTLDFARVNTNSLSPVVDQFGVFTLPYIFNDTDHKYKVLDGEVGDQAMAALADYNMIGIRYWEAGSRCFYTTNKPIKSVADLKGLKVRVQPADIAIAMVKALGAEATPMAYAEVFQGLQTGVVDGAENDFVSYYTSGHYEVAKNYTLDGHMAPPAILLCSQDAWNKMSAAQQEAVTKAADEAVIWQRQAMQDFQEESRAKVEEAGCEIIEVDVSEFQAAVADVYDQYPQYADAISKIRETK